MAAPAGAGGVSVATECAAAECNAAGFGVEAEAGVDLHPIQAIERLEWATRHLERCKV